MPPQPHGVRARAHPPPVPSLFELAALALVRPEQPVDTWCTRVLPHVLETMAAHASVVRRLQERALRPDAAAAAAAEMRQHLPKALADAVLKPIAALRRTLDEPQQARLNMAAVRWQVAALPDLCVNTVVRRAYEWRVRGICALYMQELDWMDFEDEEDDAEEDEEEEAEENRTGREFEAMLDDAIALHDLIHARLGTVWTDDEVRAMLDDSKFVMVYQSAEDDTTVLMDLDRCPDDIMSEQGALDRVGGSRVTRLVRQRARWVRVGSPYREERDWRAIARRQPFSAFDSDDAEWYADVWAAAEDVNEWANVVLFPASWKHAG